MTKILIKILLNVIISISLIFETSGISFASNVVAGQEMRTQVLFLADIIQDDGNMGAVITRAQLARMLTKASEYKDSVFDTGTSSVFDDVPVSYPYSSFVRLVSSQGYMFGYLDGTFKPDKGVVYSDLIRGCLALLGYTNDDFKGDQLLGRYKTFNALELNENITAGKQINDVVTKLEAVNAIYNVLKAKKKDSNTVYGVSIFNMTVNSDGNLNASGLLKVHMDGPFIMKKGQTLYEVLPFTPESANYFLNGSPSSFTSIQRELVNAGYVILYYNIVTRTVYAYKEGASLDSSVVVATGYVTHIYYNASDTLTPNSVEIELARYSLANSDVQFAFSYAGTVGIGDRVVFIYESTTQTEDSVYAGSLTSVFLYDVAYN